MLDVTGFSAGYQGNDVVRDVSFHVDEGEAVMIIGSNGAGKTTLFRAICGLSPTSSGVVRLNEHDVTGVPAQQIVRLGIGFVPAERHLFPRMTVQMAASSAASFSPAAVAVRDSGAMSPHSTGISPPLRPDGSARVR